MQGEELDKIFREKVEQLSDIPGELKWTPKKAWKSYQQKYLYAPVSLIRRIAYLGAAAAILAFLVFSVFHWLIAAESLIRVENNEKTAKLVYLPDSSRVWLNRNSSITYPGRNTHEAIRVNVEGEVFFELIVPGRTYTIISENACIEAAPGSAFNVNADPDREQIDITVANGAVKVSEKSYPGGLAMLIAEGEYCSIHKSHKLIYSSVNQNDNFLAWKTGKLIFSNEPMARVTDILAIYFDTEIELKDKDLAWCRFSGSFEREPIDSILNQIQTDLNLVIVSAGSKITFSGKGCL